MLIIFQLIKILKCLCQKIFAIIILKNRRSHLFILKLRAAHVPKYKLIKSALPELANFCGAIYANASKLLPVRTSKYCGVEMKNVDIIQISWKAEVNAAYKIAPKEISKRKDLSELLYEDYLKEKNCDYSLIAQNGTVIKVHSLILRMYAEKVFQNLLTSGMVESLQQAISLKDYSVSTIRAFLDFVYLGSKSFQDKAMFDQDYNLDIFELISFAHCYQVLPLVDCCTNLLCRIATEDDAGHILEVATLYDNAHLKLLYETLSAVWD